MVSLVSFRNAAQGLQAVVSRERNARIHMIFGVAAIVLSAVLHIPWPQAALVIAMVGLVFFAEVVNTAIERTLDLIATENNQVVKLIKNMAAGGVLVTAATAVLVAVCIFGPSLWQVIVAS